MCSLTRVAYVLVSKMVTYPSRNVLVFSSYGYLANLAGVLICESGQIDGNSPVHTHIYIHYSFLLLWGVRTEPIQR